MTTADPKLETIERVKAKYAAKLERKAWKLDNETGLKRLADEVCEMGVSEKAGKNGCFGAVVSVLAIVGLIIVKVVVL